MTPTDDLTPLLTLYESGLRRYIFSIVLNHAESEDVFQNVSLKALQSFMSLESKDRFAGWIFTIARNCAFQALKQMGREQNPDEEELATLLAETALSQYREHLATQPSRIEEVLPGCLEKLSSDARAALKLKYTGASYKEIADTLERTSAAIKGLLHRARAALHSCIEGRIGT